MVGTEYLAHVLFTVTAHKLLLSRHPHLVKAQEKQAETQRTQRDTEVFVPSN